MKRTSIFATMLATGLLGIVALAPGSASADVLCSHVAFNYNCPTENTYGVGTEFHSENNGNVSLWFPLSKTNISLFSCGQSELDMTVTEAGGPFFNVYPKVDITNLTFSSCDDDPTSAVQDGSALISRYNFGGSQKGRFSWSGEQIETNTENPIGGGKCTYDIVEAGTLAGAKTDETSVTKIVFNDALAEKVSGNSSCPKKAYFSARYDFDLVDPEGIYVLLE